MFIHFHDSRVIKGHIRTDEVGVVVQARLVTDRIAKQIGASNNRSQRRSSSCDILARNAFMAEFAASAACLARCSTTMESTSAANLGSRHSIIELRPRCLLEFSRLRLHVDIVVRWSRASE